MFRPARTVALAVLSVAACVVALASPAYAATWTVKVGTTASGSATYTATTNASVRFVETAYGITVQCSTVTGRGTVPHLGTGLAATWLFSDITGSWGGCTNGVNYAITQSGTWKFNATSYSAGTGTTTGNLSGVSLHVATSGCDYDVTGAVDATFRNSTQNLITNPVAGSGNVLTISHVSGVLGASSCPGIANNGDVVTLVRSYLIAAKTTANVAGALTITSP